MLFTLRDCGGCLTDDNCAFLYENHGDRASCIPRVINGTEKIPVDSIREETLCPVPSHLGWITLTGLALYLVFFAPGEETKRRYSTIVFTSRILRILVQSNGWPNAMHTNGGSTKADFDLHIFDISESSAS